MEVLVLEDYQAQREDELTLAAGDVLRDVRQGPEDGWLLGALGERRGLFPQVIVQEIPENLRADGSTRRPRSTRRGQPGGPPAAQRWCKVNFSYSPEQPDELKLQAGEIVQVLREIEDGWWLGKKNGQLGAFPSNFVQELDYRPYGAIIPDVIPRATGVVQTSLKLTGTQEDTPEYPITASESCRVLFDYEPEAPDELALQKGTVVKVLTKNTENPGWWEGEYEGKRGFFPDNFVLLLPQIKLPVHHRLSPQEAVFGRENHVCNGRNRMSKETRATTIKKMESKITLPPIKKMSSASNRPSKPRPSTPRPPAAGPNGDKLKTSREQGGKEDGGSKGGSEGGRGIPGGKSNDRSSDDSKTRWKPQGRNPPNFSQTPTPGHEEDRSSLTKSQQPKTKQNALDKAVFRDKSFQEKALSREKKQCEKPTNRDNSFPVDKPPPSEKNLGGTPSTDQDSVDKVNPSTVDKRPPSSKPSSEKLPSNKAAPEHPPSGSQVAPGTAQSERRLPAVGDRVPETTLIHLTERMDQMQAEVSSLRGSMSCLVSQLQTCRKS
ncbi:SH3 domain-containing protein 21 isoform X2 [Antechinus flavipes]|uniref:SH3 domain-containing protein 21 isoform X2 n=1 Tax=Antechinus flavipes TaxID=38775 RepID=UPI0022367BE7|nr:SH3 domain-containing protein 21 isoform X2 [Antechinus flavipes]